jgi:hypothetical protein
MASDRVRLVPAGGNGRPLGVAALIVVVIAVGLVKPWGSGAATSPPITGPVGAPTGAAASTAIGASAPALITSPAGSSTRPSNISGPCYYGLAWRLFTAETSSVGPIHTWYGIQPLQANGPTDPRIRVIKIHSSAIGQLGYCPVTLPNGPIHVLETRAWELVPGKTPRPIVLARAAGTAPANPDDGVIYLPPAAHNGYPEPVWAPSVYVFVVRLATAPVNEEWFAVDIR